MRKFWSEVIEELKKVTWPSPNDVKASFYAVCFGMLILGIYTGVIDFVLSKGMAALFML